MVMPDQSSQPSSDLPQMALLTPRGRGAVATVRFVGDCRRLDDAPPLFRAANGRPLAGQPLGRVVFGTWGSEPAEEVVVCRVVDHTLDIHCHGGEAAARRILDDLQSVGGTRQSWPVLFHDTVGQFETEGLETLAQATTPRTVEILLEQHAGVLRDAVRDCRAALHDGRDALRAQLDALLAWVDFGRHLTRPWDVVLFGRPNVGKSSLINVLVGYARSLVFDQPGTTRDVVTAETALDGWPIRLSDTAGIRDDAERLESAGIARARQRLAEADCRVLLLDIGREPHADDRRLLAQWPDALIIAHKSDQPDRWGDALPADALRVSSLTGAGVERLSEELVRRLVPRVPAPGTPIPFTERQVDRLRTARAAAEGGTETEVTSALREILL